MSTSLAVSTPAAGPADWRVLRVQKLIDAAFQSATVHVPHLTELAQQVHLGRSRLEHLFKRETGFTIKQYVKALAMQKAKELLCREWLTIKEVSFSLGYSDPANFTHDFKAFFGRSPREHRCSNFSQEIALLDKK